MPTDHRPRCSRGPRNLPVTSQIRFSKGNEDQVTAGPGTQTGVGVGGGGPSHRCLGSVLLAALRPWLLPPPGPAVPLPYSTRPFRHRRSLPRRAACPRPATHTSRGSAEGTTGQRPGHHALRSLSPASPRRDGGCLASGRLAQGGGTSPAPHNAQRLPQATTEGRTSPKS